MCQDVNCPFEVFKHRLCGPPPETEADALAIINELEGLDELYHKTLAWGCDMQRQNYPDVRPAPAGRVIGNGNSVAQARITFKRGF